jgi:hypothetical protein
MNASVTGRFQKFEVCCRLLAYKILFRKPEKRHHFEDLGLDRRILLKESFKK